MVLIQAMKNQFSILLILFILVAFISSCVKEKNFPSAPVITFKDITNKKVSTTDGLTTLSGIDCTIKFTDGDGDVGVSSTDPIPDLKVVYQFKGIDGKFHPYDNSTTSGFDTLNFPYRIPDITPQGQYKALEGEIKIQLRGEPLFPFYPLVPLQNATFRLAIIMRDRANHYSDWVYSDEVTNP